MQDRFDVVVVGAGAAGIAALRRLTAAGVDAAVLEASGRIGGRAHSEMTRAGFPVDLGCGWIHSADENVLAGPIEQAGFTIDRTPPHWMRQAENLGFPATDQQAFRAEMQAFGERVRAAAATGVDRPGSSLFEPGGRWNVMLDAFSSYYNGAEFDQVSILDYAAYEDSGVNWRVTEGYGTAIASFGDADRVVTDCAVTTIHHDGPELRLDTGRGQVTAQAVIVCVPSPAIADGRLAFSPGLPAKREAAAGLPLGLADKVFLGIEDAEELPADGHLFGRTDRTETGSYHLRPFGRPYIEVFLGGRAARGLEGEGRGALAAFAIDELAELMGSEVRQRLHVLGETHWASDPWTFGSYSHALPGHAGDRAILAAPMDGRLFFAGEATHPHFYSTAHGAWESGLRAAEEALAANPQLLGSATKNG